MNSDNWSPCIITAFDLVDMRRNAATGRASAKMLQMHRFAVAKINSALRNHSHGYVWNDSVLLLSYVTKPARARRGLLSELSEFKHSLEAHCGTQTYAISVKGLSFPQDPLASPVYEGQIAAQPRAVVLKTSSWAMANCFIIEKALGEHRADWYIDSRIASGAGLREPIASASVDLLPKNEARTIRMYKGFFHDVG